MAGRKRVTTELAQAQLFTAGKLCKGCSLVLPIEEFRLEKRDGKPRGKCRACEREYLNAWSKKQTPEQNRARWMAWRARNPRRNLHHGYMSSYGVSLEYVEALWESQDRKCAFSNCEKDLLHPLNEEAKLGEKIRVDHCHATGQVRGLLCQKHNAGLGMLGDDIEGVRAALDYLLAHRSSH